MRAPLDLREILVLREIQARLDRRVSKARKDLKVTREIKAILVSLEQIWKYIFAV
jgi:hypothetical protein